MRTGREFCKLVQSPKYGQVLAQVDIDDEGQDVLRISVSTERGVVAMSAAFGDQDAAYEALGKFDSNVAENFGEAIEEQIKEILG